MNDKMRIYYDAEGDFLEISFGKTTPSYYDHLGDGIFERRDEKTNQIKGYAIFSFQKRQEGSTPHIDLELPLPVGS